MQLVGRAAGAAEPQPEAQIRAAIEAFVRALAEDPRKARLVFLERSSAGAEAERHMRGTLRRFATLVADTAGPHLPQGIPPRELRMGALSLVGAIERVTIDWQDGELDATIDQVIDYLVRFFLAASASLGIHPEA